MSTAMNTLRYRTSARRRPSVSTRHPQIHVHMPVSGLGLGIVAPRR